MNALATALVQLTLVAASTAVLSVLILTLAAAFDRPQGKATPPRQVPALCPCGRRLARRWADVAHPAWRPPSGHSTQVGGWYCHVDHTGYREAAS